jgi:energy-coupling factor transport system permease protein
VSRLHPFTLLALAASLPLLAWILPAPGGALAPACVALLLAAAAGPRRVLLPALLTAAPFWLFLFILHGVTGMTAYGVRLTAMIASFVWLVAVLPPARLVEAMVAAGWGAPSAYLFAATLSAVPVLRQRARRIVEAQRCRGLSPRGSPAARFRALRALALPLVLSALHEVDERALALESRGLAAGHRRTPLAPPPDSPAQRSARWGLVLACVLALAWRLVWRG